MMYQIIILLFPGVLSEMSINVFGGPDPKVEISGSQTDIISDAERNAFHINDGDLKEAAKKLHGAKPDDIFVRGPTPWDDLYKRHNWDEVKRTLVLKNARILSYREQQTVIGSKNYHNNGSEPVTYQVSVSQEEDNTIEHFWTRVGYVTVTQKIDYNINVGVGGITRFSDKNSFLEDSANVIPTTVGSNTFRKITLEPGQTAVAVLTASKGEIEVEVDFEASLSGQAAANFALTYKDHHFWGYEVNSLLDAAGLPKTVSWKETILIGFYADERVIIYDLNGFPLQ